MNGDRGTLSRRLDRLFQSGTLHSLSDTQLLDRYLANGDEAAFEAIIDQHGPMVLSLCRRFLRDPVDVEDAFQATFLILVRKGQSLRQRDRLANWLYGVAYRVAIRARSNRSRRRSRETSFDSGLDWPAASGWETDDLGPVLDHELSRLPDKYRTPLVLCYLKGRTHEEAAAELSWPVGTVRSRLSRGRDLLRQRLARKGYGATAAVLLRGPSFSLPFYPSNLPVGLVDSTLAAASRFIPGAVVAVGTTALSPTISGSAMTLAQGVISTMALTKLKLIGGGLAATMLTATSLVAGGWALMNSDDRPGEQDRQPQVRLEKRGRPLAQTTPGSSQSQPESFRAEKTATTLGSTSGTGPGLEKRLSELERKIDLLVKQLVFDPQGSPNLGILPVTPTAVPQPPVVTPVPVEVLVGQPTPAPLALPAGSPVSLQTTPLVAGFDQNLVTKLPGVASLPAGSAKERPGRTIGSQPASVSFPERANLRELEAQLRIAIRRYKRLAQLAARHAISREELDEAGDQIRLILGKLRGLEDQSNEDSPRLGFEIDRKKAELEEAKASRSIADAFSARNERLNTHKPGMVSAEEVAKGKGELAQAQAQIELKQAELNEALLKYSQVRTCLNAIQELIQAANLPELREVNAP